MGFLQSVFSSMFSTAGGICSLIPNCELVLLGLKIVMLLFIVGWVREHLGGGPVATVIMLFLGYLALFQYFYIFGPMTLIYLLIVMGVGSAVTDLAFGGGEYGIGPRAREGDNRSILQRIREGDV